MFFFYLPRIVLMISTVFLWFNGGWNKSVSLFSVLLLISVNDFVGEALGHGQFNSRSSEIVEFMKSSNILILDSEELKLGKNICLDSF